MPASAALLLWLFIKSTLAPHEPAGVIVPAADLPSARSAYGWLETTAPQIIADRFDAGGLTIGRPARLGVHGTSAADTTYRVNGLDATSTLRPGLPMVLPDVVGAATIGVTRLPSDVSMNAPGPVVDWDPLPGTKRALIAETYFMMPRWSIEPSSASALPAQQLKSMGDGSLLLAGELTPGVASAMFAGHWSRAERLDRNDPTQKRGQQLSLVGNITYTPTSIDQVQGTAIIQRAESSTFATGTSPTQSFGTTQLMWRRAEKGHATYRIGGGIQWADTSTTPASTMTLDSALGGAVYPALFRPEGKETAMRVSADIALAPVSAFGVMHRLRAWGSFDRSSMTPTLAGALTLAETVDGTAARVWRVDVPTSTPSWTSSTGGLFASDRMGSEQRWIELGVRAESLSASNGGATNIRWSNVYPHAAFSLSSDLTGLGVFGSYSRAGARLPAMALAFGDVNAPNARVYRWIDANANGVVDGTEGTGSLIARVGPGGASGLTAVDPSLKRPVIDLLLGGVRYETAQFAITATAIVRKEKDFVRAIADGGAAYTTVTQADQGADFTHPSDDQQLVAYSRTATSFGLDHYTLTNPASVGTGSMYALDITAQYRGTRARLAFSAAAVKTTATAANRGFRADENDPGMIGEIPADPNASSFATQARPYFDRGYIGKIMGVFNLGAGATLGIVTRYQDGQPFARVAVVNGLAQGPEAVVTYANGRPTRFTYIQTTDVRLQKLIPFGNGSITVIVDAFNVFNIGREVEEYVLTSTAFRSVSAIEPPRTLRLGFRFSF